MIFSQPEFSPISDRFTYNADLALPVHLLETLNRSVVADILQLSNFDQRVGEIHRSLFDKSKDLDWFGNPLVLESREEAIVFTALMGGVTPYDHKRLLRHYGVEMHENVASKMHREYVTLKDIVGETPSVVVRFVGENFQYYVEVSHGETP